MKTSQPTLRIPNPEDWCDQATVVKMTGLSRATLHDMSKDGRLTAYRVGAHRLYWMDDVRRLAAAVKTLRGDRDARVAC